MGENSHLDLAKELHSILFREEEVQWGGKRSKIRIYSPIRKKKGKDQRRGGKSKFF